MILFQFFIKLTFPIRSLLDKNDWTHSRAWFNSYFIRAMDWANLLCLQSLLPDQRLALSMALIVVCSLTPMKLNCRSFCIVLAIIPRISASLPVRSEFERWDKHARLLALDIKFSTNDMQVSILVRLASWKYCFCALVGSVSYPYKSTIPNLSFLERAAVLKSPDTPCSMFRASGFFM